MKSCEIGWHQATPELLMMSNFSWCSSLKQACSLELKDFLNNEGWMVERILYEYFIIFRHRACIPMLGREKLAFETHHSEPHSQDRSKIFTAFPATEALYRVSNMLNMWHFPFKEASLVAVPWLSHSHLSKAFCITTPPPFLFCNGFEDTYYIHTHTATASYFHRDSHGAMSETGTDRCQRCHGKGARAGGVVAKQVAWRKQRNGVVEITKVNHWGGW